MSKVLVRRRCAPVTQAAVAGVVTFSLGAEPETYDATGCGRETLNKGEIIALAAALLDLADMPCDYEGNLASLRTLAFSRRKP